MTNYDLIRNMSIEEMTVTIRCPNEMGLAEIVCDPKSDKKCCLCTFHWLQQEVSVDAE